MRCVECGAELGRGPEHRFSGYAYSIVHCQRHCPVYMDGVDCKDDHAPPIRELAREGLTRAEIAERLPLVPEMGDTILVDVSMYHADMAEPVWLPVASTRYWSASAYPIKAEVPERGEGQFAIRDIQGVRHGDSDGG